CERPDRCHCHARGHHTDPAAGRASPCHHPRMRKVGAFAAVAVVALASLAVAQQAMRRPTLHEDMPGETDDRPTPMIGDTGSGTPAAFAAGDKVLPKPSVDRPDKAPKGEPVLGGGGFAADRQTSMTPDGNTGPDATLHY